MRQIGTSNGGRETQPIIHNLNIVIQCLYYNTIVVSPEGL